MYKQLQKRIASEEEIKLMEDQVRVLKEEIRENPSDYDKMLEISILYHKLGKNDLAKSNFEKIYKQNKEDKKLISSYLLYCAENNDPLAEELFESLRGEKDEQSYLATIKYYLSQDKYEEALKLLEEALEVYDDSESLTLLKIECLIKLGEEDENISSYIESVRRKFVTPSFLLFQIEYYYYQMDFDKAMKRARRFMMRFPNDENLDLVREYMELLSSSTEEELREKVTSEIEEIEALKEKNRELSGFEELNQLIGLESVKDVIGKIKKKIEFDKIRMNQLDLETINEDSSHFIFMGNPGTGKTTVARLMASIFKELGMLESGHLVEVDRSNLVAEYVGQSAKLTKKAVEEALGGVLFIDEAYGLINSDRDDFGLEVVNTLVKEIEDHRKDLIVILAGYEEEMLEFLRSNPGLESRFERKIYFDDYNDEELLEIGKSIAKKNNYKFSPDAEVAFHIVMDREKASKRFGNARSVRGVMNEAFLEKADRVSLDELDMEYLTTLYPEDFGVSMEDLDGKNLDKLLEELNSLIGLSSVKEEIKRIIDIARYNKQTKQLKMDQNLNVIFTGNPGTGKTTVARLYSEILREIGIIKRGNLVEVTRSDLVGKYQGQTAEKVRNKCEEAYGGVLFIDEAYALINGENDSFGQEALAELIKQMEDNRDKLLVILAGYTKEMNEFLDANSGLKSRIPRFIEFPDYSYEEMLEIFLSMCKSKGITYNQASLSKIKLAVKEMVDTKDQNFGNAREARNLFQKLDSYRMSRVATNQIPIEEAMEFTEEDLDKLLENKNSGEKSTEELLNKLNSLIGLEEVKNEINYAVDFAKYQKLLSSEELLAFDSQVNMHIMFTGNPGTGKTTVARLYSEILKSLGILSKGHLIEVSRSDLVGRYLGETAIKVQKVCEEAYGGVLFIDEAYSLVNSSNDSFGLEAVAELIKQMEDNRDRLVVIMAGYTREMNEFMDSNSGIKSRISKIIEFKDYNQEELVEIFDLIVREKGYSYGPGAKEEIEKIISTIYDRRDRNFGNAREMRSLFDEIFKSLVQRVVREQVSAEERKTIKIDDLRGIGRND